MGIQAQQTQDTSRQTSSNNAKDVPSEKEFSDLFEEAMHRSSNIKTEITQDEQQKFLKAMKDPDFRSLLNDYMKEISDPSNREETERYLAQLEGENKVPEDKILIQPTPGFVTKTIWEDEKQKQKVFVNICTSAKINPPSSTKVEATKHTKAGSSWSLPYSAGPERVEKDHAGSDVITFDVCYHPTTLVHAARLVAFRDMVVNTALDAIEGVLRKTRSAKGTLKKEFKVLKGVSYKSGQPVTMCIRKEVIELETTKQATPSTKKVADKENTKLTANSSQVKPSSVKSSSSVAPTKKSRALVQEINPSETPSTPVNTELKQSEPQKEKQLTYQVVYRGRFEMTDHMLDGSKTVNRPRELVVKIELPQHTSARGVELDVAEQEVKVSTAGYTPLRLTLPFPVIEAKGSAKFDKRLRQLVVTLPVQAPPVTQIVPKLEDKTVSSEDTEEEDDTSNDQEEQAVPEEELKVEPLPSSVKTNVNPHARWRAENKAPEVDEFIHLREIAKMSLDDPWILKQSTMNDSNTKVEEKPATALIKNDDTPELMNDDMPPLESFSDEEDFDEIEVEKHHHDNQAEEQPIFEEEAIQRPEFIMKQTSKCISFLIQVPNVDESSIIKSFEPCNFELRFRSGETKQLFELKMKLQKEIDPQDCVVDAAKKNLVLVLRKTPQTQGIWSNVEASSEPILSTLKPLNKEKRSVQFNDKIDVQEFHKEDSSSSIQSANKSKESVMEQQQQEPESTTQETSSTPFTLAEPFVAAAIAEAEAIPAPVPTISLTQFRNKVMFELD